MIPAPRKVLAVVGSRTDQTTIESASAFAARHGASLDIFNCVEAPPDIEVLARAADRTPEQLLDDLCQQRRAGIQAQLDRYLPGRQVNMHQCTGKTFIEVIRHVIASETDFVVKAAEPLTGMHRFLFTSTDQHLLRKCPCPVWLQTPDSKPVPRNVLAAVDVDVWDADEPGTLRSLNRRVIETACRVAAPAGAKVLVLHAWDAMGEGMVWAFSSKGDARVAADNYVNDVLVARRAAMDDLLREVADNSEVVGNVKLIPHLVRGAPEHVIEEQSRAQFADVVVMGTVARTGLSGVFIGNTAENIINNLECPVLAVKPEGFVSPLGQL